RVHLLLSCFTSALSPSALPFPYPTLFRSGCNRLRKLAGMDDAAVRHHFAEHVYGVPPTGPAVEPSWERLEEGPAPDNGTRRQLRSEEHTSELQSRFDLGCRRVPEKQKETN